MSKKRRVRVRYRRATIELTSQVKHEHVYSGRCQSCGASGKTDLHHYFYAYSTAQVRKNPLLVLDFTVELCFKCHTLADMLRNLANDLPRVRMLIKTLGVLNVSVKSR